MALPSPLRLAVDIGGTFTDTVLMDGRTLLASTKTPTTPRDPTAGALAGVRQLLAERNLAMAEIAGFIHGTTLATNALIERRGATVASLTTAGFRDILEIANERRYDQYDIGIEKPDLLVPRRRCFTIAERMDAGGRVLQPLDAAAVPELVASMRAAGVEAVAVCLLHSYANPEHERQLAALLQQQAPELRVSLSSEVSPEAREFDRLCTTVANAYIQPLMADYLRGFAERFAAEGLDCPILMMTAGGGMTALETAARLPIRLVESGPAGGAILAAQVARSVGAEAVLSFDMGGTTAKLCLIDQGQPQSARQFEIARAARFIKGSGMPVRIPVVEMIEIGAGGGSIAKVDRLGRLCVGPESAGSDPGPAGFARGGTDATVTDADIALAYIDPDQFAEGRLRVDPALSAQALAHDLGTPLGLTVTEAAHGVSQIVDESMAAAARMHAVESGKDIAARLMIAFGGNGPLHATRAARRAGIERILVPPSPGVGSAVGFLCAPVSFEIVRSHYCTLDALDQDGIAATFASMREQARAVVEAGAPGATTIERCSAFMRYRGQGHEIEIDLPNGAPREDQLTALQVDFEAVYRQQFSRVVPGMQIEILNWALRLSTEVPAATPPSPTERSAQAKTVDHREIHCDLHNRPTTAAIYRRIDLRAGDCFEGPALVIEAQTTTLVSADFHCHVDGAGNLLLARITRPSACEPQHNRSEP